VLRGHVLISFIDGRAFPPCPTITSSTGVISSNSGFKRWHQQDQLILVWLFTSISPPILAQVINCDASQKLWRAIKQFHTSQSPAKMLKSKLILQTSEKRRLILLSIPSAYVVFTCISARFQHWTRSNGVFCRYTSQLTLSR
jgi:hypothetical protein